MSFLRGLEAGVGFDCDRDVTADIELRDLDGLLVFERRRRLLVDLPDDMHDLA